MKLGWNRFNFRVFIVFVLRFDMFKSMCYLFWFVFWIYWSEFLVFELYDMMGYVIIFCVFMGIGWFGEKFFFFVFLCLVWNFYFLDFIVFFLRWSFFFMFVLFNFRLGYVKLVFIMVVFFDLVYLMSVFWFL